MMSIGLDNIAILKVGKIHLSSRLKCHPVQASWFGRTWRTKVSIRISLSVSGNPLNAVDSLQHESIECIWPQNVFVHFFTQKETS